MQILQRVDLKLEVQWISLIDNVLLPRCMVVLGLELAF
jgi:hypothetical protein